MSLSSLLNTTPPAASYLDLYVNSITAAVPIIQPTYYIECLNNNAQGLPAAYISQPQQYNTILNQNNFPSPSGVPPPPASVFKPTKAGYYDVSFSTGITNTSGLTLNGIRFSSWIQQNGTTNYAVNTVTTTLAPNDKLVLSGSYVVRFNGTTDYVQILAAQSSLSIIFTGDNVINLQQNKVTLHYLHD